MAKPVIVVGFANGRTGRIAALSAAWRFVLTRIAGIGPATTANRCRGSPLPRSGSDCDAAPTAQCARLLARSLSAVHIGATLRSGVGSFQSGLYSACGVARLQASSKAATISRIVRGSELKV
jgi:hypothetical protein